MNWIQKFLLAGLVAATPVMRAQSVLVSNLPDTTTTTGNSVCSATDHNAVSFQTGTGTAQLHSVDLLLSASVNFANCENAVVKLLSDDGSGNVGSIVRTLFGSASKSGDAWRFTPSTQFTLQPSTKYWITLGTSSDVVTWHSTSSLTETGPGSLPATKNWAFSSNGGTSWFLPGTGNPFQFAVNYVTGTAISLATFNAEALSDRVSLAWRTGTEFEHAGFHVWRSARVDGGFARITSAMIPAKGTGQGGADYIWTDLAVQPGQTWFYQLEDVDTHGVSTFHGPVSATVGATSGIFAFTATPPSIFLGGGSWLAWSATGALTLNGEAVSGTTQWVAPKATTGYTLADANGATRLVTVAVRPFAVKDMAGLARAWGSTKGEAAYDPAFDMNGDGKVDDLDAALCLK